MVAEPEIYMSVAGFCSRYWPLIVLYIHVNRFSNFTESNEPAVVKDAILYVVYASLE